MTTVSPDFLDYPFEIRRLTEAEGGGFLITFPDLPGCMSDGETLEEAVANGKDAFACWMIAHIEAGREIPHPGESRLVALVPKSLRARLEARAREEGMDINAFITAFLAEGLGRMPNTCARATLAATSLRRPKVERLCHPTVLTCTALGRFNHRC
jgi:antitoxin HicB